MGAQLLLDRLQNVRQYGSGWRADCPNGHNNTRGSLSVLEADDGRVLIHCFACNDTLGVLRAIGLEMTDLFPERIKDPSPEARRASIEAFKRSAFAAALGVLDREATIVQIAATDTFTGKTLSAKDVVRVGVAAERIARSREVLK